MARAAGYGQGCGQGDGKGDGEGHRLFIRLWPDGETDGDVWGTADGIKFPWGHRQRWAKRHFIHFAIRAAISGLVDLAIYGTPTTAVD